MEYGLKKKDLAIKSYEIYLVNTVILTVCVDLWFSARMAGLQEDNKNLKLSLSKVEAERKQAQERSNNLEKVQEAAVGLGFVQFQHLPLSCKCFFFLCDEWRAVDSVCFMLSAWF